MTLVPQPLTHPHNSRGSKNPQARIRTWPMIQHRKLYALTSFDVKISLSLSLIIYSALIGLNTGSLTKTSDGVLLHSLW